MSPETMVFKCKIRIWWFIFFGFQLILLALMIGSIFSRRMFYMMQISEFIYCICEGFTVIAMVIWIISMFCYSKSVGCFNMTYCGSICSCFCHYLGFFTWLGTSLSHLSYCRGFSNEAIDSGYDLCEKDGPNLAIAIMVLLPIVMGAFFTVLYYAKNGKKQIPNQKKEENIHCADPENSQPFQGVVTGPVTTKHLNNQNKEDSKNIPYGNPVNPQPFSGVATGPVAKHHKNRNNKESEKTPRLAKNKPPKIPKKKKFTYSEDPPENSDIYLIYYDPSKPPDFNESDLNIEFLPLPEKEDSSDD